MGGVLSTAVSPVLTTAFSAIDTYQRTENTYMKKIRDGGPCTVTVEEGDGYIIRRSNAAKNKSLDEIAAEFTSEKTMPLLLKQACQKFASKNRSRRRATPSESPRRERSYHQA